MTKFCEYMSPFGGVCMQPQAPQQLAPDSELLRYCDTHLGVLRRERERTRRLHARRLAPQTQSNFESDTVPTERPRSRSYVHAAVARSRSEPYLQRSTSRTLERSDSRRFTFLDDSEDEIESENDRANRGVDASRDTGALWVRSISSPPRLQRDGNSHRADAAMGGDDSPQTVIPEEGLRKRVRVKRIVIPPRFEVLDDTAPATPPKVWYVRLAERVAGEPGDPDDDEYIEVDASSITTAASGVVS